MRRLPGSLLLAAGAAGLLVAGAPGRAQDFAPSVSLYSGAPAQNEGIRLRGWGSGKATEDRTYKAAGDVSIKVETAGYYSGARIEWDRSIDISPQKGDPFGFLELTIRFQPGTLRNRSTTTTPGSFPGAAGGVPSSLGPGAAFPGGGSSGFGAAFRGSGGSFPGGSRRSGGAISGSGGFPGGFAGASSGFPGGYPGSGFGAAYGGLGGAGGVGGQSAAPDTHKMKLLLVCQEGSFAATDFPVVLNPARDEGWYTVAIPFVAFRGLDRASTARLKELRVFGDYKDTFWIGEIRTTTDDEPINVDSLDDLEVAVGEPVELSAQASGGISPLHYSWDFDISDGIQEDATGQTVVHVFRKKSPEVPGNALEVQPYVVTLTVRDLSGAKKSVRRTANVIVNP